MKKSICSIAVFSVILTVVCAVLYSTRSIGACYTLAVTFGTIAYHFLMRLGVGFVFDRLMKNQADYTKKWYQCRDWERKLYDRLDVKHWKNRMPSYEPEYFDPKKHSWEEIAQAMCQAELVHEVIAVLSFLPIIASLWFGALPVFIITSVAAAAADLVFVMIQRYNRPRVIRLIRG